MQLVFPEPLLKSKGELEMEFARLSPGMREHYRKFYPGKQTHSIFIYHSIESR